jgi:thymidylate kinase
MFIVLDSIDGAGKGKQREEILKYLTENTKLEVKSEGFPVHNNFYNNIIHPALQEEVKMNSASWVLSYLLDKTLEAPEIEKHLGINDRLYLADGYFTTTIAYQSFLMEQVSLEKILDYGKDFKIPVPDLAIFIDADPEVAFQRKKKEEGHDEGLDIFEKSLEKQRRLQKIFRNMVEKNIFCKWEIVDGNGNIEEVKNNILQVLKKYKYI